MMKCNCENDDNINQIIIEVLCNDCGLPRNKKGNHNRSVCECSIGEVRMGKIVYPIITGGFYMDEHGNIMGVTNKETGELEPYTIEQLKNMGAL